MKIGMLTSGGDCQGLNSALRGVAKSLYFRFGKDVEIYGIRDGYRGLIEGDLKKMSPSNFSGILTLGGTILGTSRQSFKTMCTPMEEYNGKTKLDKMLETYKKYKLDALVILGGNGTHKTANLLAQNGVNVVSLPKTIDNDLALTDHCPGYGSAARFIANNTRDLWMEVRAMPMYVTIMETMGRNAGWLTAAGSIPDYDGKPCAQLVYLPEYAFDENAFLADVDNLLHKQREILIVVSEGLADENGKMIADLGIVDGFGHKLAGGAAQALCDKVTARLGVRARAERHGFLGRCSMIMQSAQDREEAIAVGRHAVRLAFSGHTGLMAAIRRDSDHPYAWSLTEVPLENVANLERKFPLEWINQGRNGITDEFRTYALPLIGEPLPPYAVLSGR